VQTPEYCHKTATIGKSKIERKKERKTQIKRGSPIAYVLWEEGERNLINQSIQFTNIRAITLFI